MYYSNKGKQQKPSLKNISILSSPTESQATNRHKIFTRKPANLLSSNNSQKKRKLINSSSSLIGINTANIERKLDITQFNHEIPLKQKKICEQNKQVKTKKQDQLKRFRDIFYSPQSYNMNLIKGSCPQIKQIKNKYQVNIENKQVVTSILTKSSLYNMNKEKTNQPELNLSSSQLKKRIKPFYASSSTDLALDKEQRIKKKSIQFLDRSIMLQCSYCTNNKLKATILQQKYKKLQEQFNNKNQNIHEITKKCLNLQQSMKENKETLHNLEKSIKQYDHKLQISQKIIAQLTIRADSLKKDVMNLNESLKYKQMQRSMLLRFKDQFQLISKQFDKLSNQHELLKKQNILLHNNRSNYQGMQKNLQPRINFTKKQQNSNVYYDYEDDSVSIISLDLSQHSLDRY